MRGAGHGKEGGLLRPARGNVGRAGKGVAHWLRCRLSVGLAHDGVGLVPTNLGRLWRLKHRRCRLRKGQREGSRGGGGQGGQGARSERGAGCRRRKRAADVVGSSILAGLVKAREASEPSAEPGYGEARMGGRGSAPPRRRAQRAGVARKEIQTHSSLEVQRSKAMPERN